MSDSTENQFETSISFADFNLPEPVIRVLQEIGYEKPSPIQASSIPVLLNGTDLIGQAQTGTGKTAAFALPIIAKIDLNINEPQVLVLAPTRELAIQVAEAFMTYTRYLKGFNVLPIYGGQSVSQQLRQLKRGPQVIVGTPGRVMDHMRRGKLKWDRLHTLVLDEADEMLRMGFIEDVEWILEQTPEQRQIALFSATMPKEIRRVANRFLNSPEEIKIKTKTTTASTIKQQYLVVANPHKLDALTRVLEVEAIDGVIIFVRTKTATMELSDKLSARGYACAAINGDMQQSAREQTIEQLKQNRLDILVATDVAARGLDVSRISHVINYDITQDVESYVHRIGRTGRAGRQGCAILFITPREKRMLALIEKVTGKSIDRIGLPSTETINDQRVEKFKHSITEKIESGDLQPYLEILEAYQYETNRAGLEIAAALASLAHEKSPLLVEDMPSIRESQREGRGDRKEKGRREKRQSKKAERNPDDFSAKAEALADFPDIPMERFVIMAGYADGVKPSNVVGAIANEVDLESHYIGHIQIYDDFTSVDLPGDMPRAAFAHLKKVRVCGKAMNLTKAKDFDLKKLQQKRPKADGDFKKRPAKKSRPAKRKNKKEA
ncbi:DEAD/DEAH box helicase [Aliikangiella maris]|uniref:ATP-dependent RNA helicase DeaD n=2 Tax=Aliikangiella maris TaxID=3162458 RepID=A0ABV3MHV2_9GAMM